ncbi:MAG: glycosyltransferase family 4 protein, partial [Aquificaceae bacterium]
MKGSIAIVHKLFPIDVDGVLGGAETVTVETAIGLKKAGWEVYVFGWIVDGDKVRDDIHFIDYGEDYRLYDVFQRYKNINFEACFSVQAYSVKTLIGFENIKRHFLIPQDMSFVDHQVGTYFINKYVDGVICLSEFQKRAYLEWGVKEEKLIKIPYGIDISKYRPISEKKIDRIIFAGATIKEKGIDILIDAFKKVKSQLPHLELHIYGDSSLWGRKESIEVKDIGIFLHGKVGKEEIIKAYSESILCVIPTVPELYRESLPRSSLEAQACGCPVIGTKSGGLPETFIDGETGFLLDPLSSQSLANTILKALSHRERLRLMSERCIEHIKESFLWEKQIEKLEDYILSVKPRGFKIDGLAYKGLKILYYTEVPLMPSKTSSCNRNYQTIKILLEKGADITYTHGFFINKAEKEVERLSKLYKNFRLRFPIYKNLNLMDEVDVFWITEVWDLDRLRKALNLARRAKLIYGVPVVFDAMDSLYKHMLSGKSA